MFYLLIIYLFLVQDPEECDKGVACPDDTQECKDCECVDRPPVCGNGVIEVSLRSIYLPNIFPELQSFTKSTFVSFLSRIQKNAKREMTVVVEKTAKIAPAFKRVGCGIV